MAEPARQQSLEPWTGTWTAVPDSLTSIRHALTDFADRAGASRRTRDAVALAVSEAATNAIVHGYIATEPGQLVITASLVDREMLRIVVTDDGRGMQPRPDSPGLGLGLPLMANLAERLNYGTSNGMGGTVVSMDFRLLT